MSAMDCNISSKESTSQVPGPSAGRRRKYDEITPDVAAAGVSIRSEISLPTGPESSSIRNELGIPAPPGAFPETPARRQLHPSSGIVTLPSRRSSQNIFLRGYNWISSWFAHRKNPFANNESGEPLPARPEKRLRVSAPGACSDTAPGRKAKRFRNIGNTSPSAKKPVALPTISDIPIAYLRTPYPSAVSDAQSESSNFNIEDFVDLDAINRQSFKLAIRDLFKKSPLIPKKNGKGKIANNKKEHDSPKWSNDSKIQKTQKNTKRYDIRLPANLQSEPMTEWFERFGPGGQASLMRLRLCALKMAPKPNVRIYCQKLPGAEMAKFNVINLIGFYRRPTKQELDERNRIRILNELDPIEESHYDKVEAAYTTLEEEEAFAKSVEEGEDSSTSHSLHSDGEASGLETTSRSEEAAHSMATDAQNLTPVPVIDKFPLAGASAGNHTIAGAPIAPTIDNDLSSLEDAPPAPPETHTESAGETSALLTHTPIHQGVLSTRIKHHPVGSLASAPSCPTDNPALAKIREFYYINSPPQDSPDTPSRTDVPGTVPNAFSPASPSKEQNPSGPENPNTKTAGDGESPTRRMGILGDRFSTLEVTGNREEQKEEEDKKLEDAVKAEKDAAEEKKRKEEAELEAALKAEKEVLEQQKREEEKEEEEEEEEQEAKSKKEEAEKIIRELEEKQIVHALPEEWKLKVQNVMAAKNPGKEVTGNLSRKDFGTLLPQSRLDGVGWLNDEIVNEFLDVAVKKKLDEIGWRKTSGTAPKFHAFNTHLFSTFQSKGYSGVSRWATRAKLGGKRLLDTEKILIPINDCAHWTLLTISGKDRLIHYYDSLGGNPKRYTDFALQYLAKELGKDFREDEWKIEKAWSRKQNNSNDCGVFVCMNGLSLVTGKTPGNAFETKDMPLAREMVAGILLGKEL